VKREVAEQVWLDVLGIWGLTDTSAADREVLRDKLTQALTIATSKDEENLETEFFFNSEWFCVRAIADAMSTRSATNDSHLRVWVRSYDAGYFATAIYDALGNPANRESRMEVSARSGAPVEHAPYCCDVFDAVVRHSGRDFSSFELGLHTKYRSFRTDRARLSANQVGMAAARNDDSGRVARGVVDRTPAQPKAYAAAPERLQFTSI